MWDPGQLGVYCYFSLYCYFYYNKHYCYLSYLLYARHCTFCFSYIKMFNEHLLSEGMR